MRAEMLASDARDAPWYDGFRPASAKDAPRAVRAAGGDLWFGYHCDCDATAIANARASKVGIGAWTVNLRDRKKRKALSDRALDVLCVDYLTSDA